jgi:hypothetical protein
VRIQNTLVSDTERLVPGIESVGTMYRRLWYRVSNPKNKTTKKPVKSITYPITYQNDQTTRVPVRPVLSLSVPANHADLGHHGGTKIGRDELYVALHFNKTVVKAEALYSA